MSHRSLPPSASSGAYRPGLVRLLGASQASVPAPAIAPRSYEVRIRKTVGDAIYLVGHDRNGEPMMEMKIKRKHLTPSMVRGLEHWCRTHDEPVDLKAI